MIYGVDLYWLPLGAGGHFVQLNGRVYEACDAAIHRRSRYDLYHSALEARPPRSRAEVLAAGRSFDAEPRE